MKKRKGGRKMKSIISREIARKEGWFSSQWIFFCAPFCARTFVGANKSLFEIAPVFESEDPVPYEVITTG